MKNAFLCSFAVSLRMEGDLTWVVSDTLPMRIMRSPSAWRET